ncbi:MAG: T9SS type A sorting domain-containing protein, partial [Candidatus Cloacimonetes bacterium]|nr:T9SS type A sorting domain-containing protein [Candidatus Cloacimonadota bacterium]
PIQLPISEELQLMFYAGFCDMYTSYPGMSASLSDDNGVTWNSLWQNSSAQGNNWHWRPIYADLSEWSGQEVLIRFIASGYSYADVSIDHFRVVDLSTVGTEDVIQPSLSEVFTYPNPFHFSSESERSGGVTIKFTMSQPGLLKASVYDIKGRKVSSIAEKYYHSGEQTIKWNAMTENNKPAASGVYLIKLSDERESKIVKMMIVK